MKKIISLLLALILVLSVPAGALAEGEAEPVKTGSIFDLLADVHIEYEIDLIAYYLSEMRNAAVAGDIDAGHTAEVNRNELIDLEGSAAPRIAFDDLYLLAKLICSEAGSDLLSDDFRMCVGEVVLNRVASPEYPNTLREVVYQRGQYSTVSTAGFVNLVPSESCVDLALRLLQGERKMVESVVFQSNTIQGEVFTTYSDRKLGTTYFCVSPNQELYPIG